MRTEGQIRHKLKQVLYRRLQKRIREVYKPSNCVCQKKVVGGGCGNKVGFCSVFTQKNSNKVLCDDDVSGCVELLSSCSMFQPVVTKEAVKEDFKKFLKESKIEDLASVFPDVVALMWALDEKMEDVLATINYEEEETTNE